MKPDSDTKNVRLEVEIYGKTVHVVWRPGEPFTTPIQRAIEKVFGKKAALSDYEDWRFIREDRSGARVERPVLIGGMIEAMARCDLNREDHSLQRFMRRRILSMD